MGDLFWTIMSILIAIPLVLSTVVLFIFGGVMVYQDKEASSHAGTE